MLTCIDLALSLTSVFHLRLYTIISNACLYMRYACFCVNFAVGCTQIRHAQLHFLAWIRRRMRDQYEHKLAHNKHTHVSSIQMYIQLTASRVYTYASTARRYSCHHTTPNAYMHATRILVQSHKTRPHPPDSPPYTQLTPFCCSRP